MCPITPVSLRLITGNCLLVPIYQRRAAAVKRITQLETVHPLPPLNRIQVGRPPLTIGKDVTDTKLT
uniref:Uncharacterized protein n=1 Tax=Knipowitschia caucasica TaxID=637954 RepID=A0AAV2KYC8_KNICA